MFPAPRLDVPKTAARACNRWPRESGRSRVPQTPLVPSAFSRSCEASIGTSRTRRREHSRLPFNLAVALLGSRVSGDEAIVRVQGPVRLSLYTEPEPDVVLLRPRADFYASAHPGPADVLLLVEVADSSIDFDRDVKAYVYAQSGVPEYWLVDLTEDRVVRYTLPAEGAYQLIEPLSPDARVAPGRLPRCLVRAGDLLP